MVARRSVVIHLKALQEPLLVVGSPVPGVHVGREPCLRFRPPRRVLSLSCKDLAHMFMVGGELLTTALPSVNRIHPAYDIQFAGRQRVVHVGVRCTGLKEVLAKLVHITGRLEML